MGFIRHKMPQSLDRSALRCVVANFVSEREIAEVLAAQDPFRIEHDCINPAGHQLIGSCGDVVCCHCGKVFWS